MKITLDMDDRIKCVFVNYVVAANDGFIVSCKSFSTEDLKEGAVLDVHLPEVEE